MPTRLKVTHFQTKRPTPSLIKVKHQKYHKQECIPVGYVPARSLTSGGKGGCTCPGRGGVPAGGRGCTCPRGVYLPGGVPA